MFTQAKNPSVSMLAFANWQWTLKEVVSNAFTDAEQMQMLGKWITTSSGHTDWAWASVNQHSVKI